MAMRLIGVAAQWARFSRHACGAKAHIIYDPDADALRYLACRRPRWTI